MSYKNVQYDAGKLRTGNGGGGVTDVEVDGVSVVNAQGVAEIPAIPDEVVANPQGTASTNLTKLQVGNDIYAIPSGGGGGSVDVTNKITVHSGIRLDSGFTYKAYQNDKIITLWATGTISSGYSNSEFDLFDIDASIVPLMNTATYAFGAGSSNARVSAYTRGAVSVNTGGWARFFISWCIA